MIYRLALRLYAKHVKLLTKRILNYSTPNMLLTLQTIEELEERFSLKRTHGALYSMIEIVIMKDILPAARWALENGYRPVSMERISFEEVTKMEQYFSLR